MCPAEAAGYGAEVTQAGVLAHHRSRWWSSEFAMKKARRRNGRLCSLSSGAGRYAVTASSGANCVSIFAEALKKSWIDWLKR